MSTTLPTPHNVIAACIYALVLMLSLGHELKAQGACSCQVTEELKTLDICIDNNTYNVTVFGCSQVAYAAPLLPATCSGLLQNQLTTIRRVCFNGAKPTAIDAMKTFGAIFCTMRPVNNDSSWNGGVIPPSVDAIWCWTVSTPKCVTINQSTGCIVACGDKCCRYEMRWRQTADGPYLTQEWHCSVGTNCAQSPCEELETCPKRENCCTRDE